MDAHIESPQVVFVPGSSLRTWSSFSLSRLALPALCVVIAASVGTATGITLAKVDAPNGVVEASSDSGQNNSTSAKAAIHVAANTRPASVVQTAVVAPLAASSSQTNADASHSAAKAAELRQSQPSIAEKAQTQSSEQIALNSPPDAITPATFTLAGKEWPVARPMSMPVADPARQQLASPSLAASTALDPIQSSLAQTSLDDAAKPAVRYVEGDLSVAAYDAMTGTLQTKDGKTFILGTSVAAGNATSWDEYRSGVHYRCDQTGSCILMRAGAVAPNARLI
jgi:hypothetical protein